MIKLYIFLFFIAVIYFVSATIFLKGGWLILGYGLLAVSASLILKFVRHKYAYKGIADPVKEDPYKDIDLDSDEDDKEEIEKHK